MHSCLYVGRVAHVRREPVIHRFRYPLAMAYLDLDEAEQTLRASRIANTARFGPASFCVAYHAPGLAAVRTATDLANAIRDAVAAHGIPRPAGPVRLLTQLRQWGLYFSPLNLYFCYAAGGARVAAVVAEVSNTPWNQRRHYVLAAPASDDAATLRCRHAKDFHVSPFMGMQAEYHWRTTLPGEQLQVCIRSHPTSTPSAPSAPFTAAMTLRRRRWSDANLLRLASRFPASSLRVLAAIYWQALRLWIKRCPYSPPPAADSGLR